VKLLSKYPEVSYKEIEILTSPGTAWKEQVKMIPAIKIDTHILTGVLLTELQIDNFLNQHLAQ